MGKDKKYSAEILKTGRDNGFKKRAALAKLSLFVFESKEGNVFGAYLIKNN
jgi:hypothetical protein